MAGPFVPSAAFTGRAEGYVFKMGSKGLGYYLDSPPLGWYSTSPTTPAHTASLCQISLHCRVGLEQPAYEGCHFGWRVMSWLVISLSGLHCFPEARGCCRQTAAQRQRRWWRRRQPPTRRQLLPRPQLPSGCRGTCWGGGRRSRARRRRATPAAAGSSATTSTPWTRCAP